MVNLQRSSKSSFGTDNDVLLLLIPILHNIASAHATLEKLHHHKMGLYRKHLIR